MIKKDLKYIKIENRGKVDEDLLIISENLLKKIYFEVEGGIFQTLCPKMFNILKEEDLREEEICGFEFTLLYDIFKGRVHIKQTKEGLLNVTFFKRYPSKGKFVYELYKEIINISFENLFNQFDFIIKGENRKIKTGNIYLLKNGLIGIVRKYYSNQKIGIVYDEDSPEIEEYVTIEDFDKLFKEKK